MARKLTVTILDDVTGEEIPESEVRQLEFSYKGASYALDVSEATEASVDQYFQTLIGNSQPVSKAKRGKSKSANATGTGSKAKEIRAWARENGHEVSERGRIQSEVIAAYEEAHAA